MFNKWFTSPTAADRNFNSAHEVVFHSKPSMINQDASGSDVIVRKRIKYAEVPHYDNNALRGEHGKYLCRRSVTNTTGTVLLQRGKNFAP